MKKKLVFVAMSPMRPLRDRTGQVGRRISRGLVFVGMSGGVDSSVAALLLKKQGYDVVGIFMRCYNVDGCAEQDAEDARRVAEHIGIPFYTWDFEKEYKKRVVEYMVKGYRAGLTPNPDVECNREIKFGLFFKKALTMGAEYVATGHYVRRRATSVKGQKTFKLLQAKDKNKDQSYFLWTLTQDQLRHCLFPIGEYIKPEVRVIARRARLPTAEKKDSQGICFLGKVTLADFLKQYIKEEPGTILTTDGRVIGKHRGAYFYTIGQRHGLDLSGKHRALGIKGRGETKPHYVVGKDITTNTVVVAEGSDNLALFQKKVSLNGIRFISKKSAMPKKISVMARVRYRQPLSQAILLLDSREKGVLVFKQPQKFVAPGQSAVFYKPRRGFSSNKASTFDKSTVDKSEDMEMLGGGVIMVGALTRF